MTFNLVEEVDGYILPTADMAEMMHHMQVRRFGGGSGVRDRRLLESALSRGRAILSWSDNPDIIEAACAMGEGVIQNHPFIDGNKRTGFAVITSTLHANGFIFDMDPVPTAQMIVDFAAGRLDSAAFRTRIRSHTRLDTTSAEIEILSANEGLDVSA